MHSDGQIYYVYVMTNRSKTLYTGVCRSLENRVFQHKNKLYEGFTSRYQIDRLVYFERSTTFAAPSIGRSKSKAGCGSEKSP